MNCGFRWAVVDTGWSELEAPMVEEWLGRPRALTG